MDDWEKKKLKMFAKHIVNDSFKEIYNVLRGTPRELKSARFWFYASIPIVIFSVIFGDRFTIFLSLVLLTFSFLKKKYDSGEFMKEYAYQYRKIIKEAKKNESDTRNDQHR